MDFNTVARMLESLNNSRTTDNSENIRKRNNNNNFYLEWNQSSQFSLESDSYHN